MRSRIFSVRRQVLVQFSHQSFTTSWAESEVIATVSFVTKTCDRGRKY